LQPLVKLDLPRRCCGIIATLHAGVHHLGGCTIEVKIGQ
jgi:hypothetical protein